MALTTLLGVPMAMGSAAAATPTINCDAVSHSSPDWSTCRQLVGTASCYWNNGDGTYTVALGYINPSGEILTAAAGTDNNGIPANGTIPTFANPGRLTTFYPGTSQTAFTMTWDPWSDFGFDWYIMDRRFTFTTANTPACTSSPVPIMGNAIAAAVGGALLVGLFVVANRRRLARVARSPWLRRQTAASC